MAQRKEHPAKKDTKTERPGPPAFGTRLRILREELGFSRYRLAKNAELSLTAVSQIEDKGRDPGWSTVVMIARALGVSVADFDEPAAPRPATAAPAGPMTFDELLKLARGLGITVADPPAVPPAPPGPSRSGGK